MSDRRWIPPLLLAMGWLLVVGLGPDRIQPKVLRSPLASLPEEFGQFRKVKDSSISQAEIRVAGMDQYLYRFLKTPEDNQLSLYVGFYERQESGKSIHSPKNCLPGSGWEELTNDVVKVSVAGRTVPVNRYLLYQGNRRALVYYWYQGRGRVEASEYLVKWFLLKDSAFRRRTDEALVRTVIFLSDSLPEKKADELSRQVIEPTISALEAILPAA